MTSKFTVFIHLPGQLEAVPGGGLEMTENGSEVLQSVYGYGSRYIERKDRLEIDPLTLALVPGKSISGLAPPDTPGGRLTEFGAFRDAAPDLWGRRVIENKLNRAGPLPASLYLEHAGSNRLGALDFRDKPNDPPHSRGAVPYIELGYLQEASEKVLAGERLPARLAALFDAGPSMGGARPKAVIVHDGREWLAKFRAKDDRFDIPLVEYATLKLAKEAGLDVPELRLEDIGGKKVLLVERFDRQPIEGGFARRHFLSALTMLCRHESESRLSSYQEIAEAIARYGAAGNIGQDLRELFGRMIFNILVNNTDDHLRNHGFVFDASAKGWRLSKLYDVVPDPVVSHERYLHLGVGTEGRLATLTNAMSRHGVFKLTHADAKAIVDCLCTIVREWKTYFEKYGVPGSQVDYIADAFRHPRDLGWETI